MIIRIHETDFEGHPVSCTGEYYSGDTALDIIEGMKLNPFQHHLTPMEYMRSVLDNIGEQNFKLPEDDEEWAANEFLNHLVALGYAMFYLNAGGFTEDGEYIPGTPMEKEKF